MGPRRFSRGTARGVVFLFALAVLLCAGGYILAVNADRHAIESKASVVQLCQAGNEARAQQVQLWQHIIAITAPPPPQAPARVAQRAALIISFQKYLDKVFALRDCASLGGS